MKLSSLFKTSSESSSSYSPWPWPLPACGKPKTLSFRAEENIFKTLNSTYQLDDMTSYSLEDHEFFSESERSFSNTTIDASELSIGHHDYIETVIRGLRLEKERLFFEPEKTSSIILEETNKNINDEEEEEEGNNITPLFKESTVLMALDSKDPFVDFRKSMEEMVEAYGIQDWENLEELLTCYLKVNCKSNHGYIVGAFVDLLVSLSFTSENINSGSSSSSSSCAIMATIVEENCLSSTITSHSFTSPLSFCSSISSTTSTSACLSLLLEEAEIIQQNVDSSTASSSHI
ncbi:PREDICTED: transcription repressor OFP15-like [Nicotiana attenuata]|uniref:Transcription repressor n=1 Tax=Nicotiana attenuata TaxID=49451 RepID=A0A314KZ22_NICAT|nr:PREDICTED: transcription repressor OFP15-like [Nicotiana attenuata]OIT34543.1 transcription repressor ofp13 [Nicotiana attenuata]